MSKKHITMQYVLLGIVLGSMSLVTQALADSAMKCFSQAQWREMSSQQQEALHKLFNDTGGDCVAVLDARIVEFDKYIKQYQSMIDDATPLLKETQEVLKYGKARGAFRSGDYTTTIKELQPLAEQGDVISQYMLGDMSEKGLGMPADYAKAFRWYRLCADQEYAACQILLGYLYRRGLGVAQNDKEAVRWYRKAAEKGDASGQGVLGLMYLKGLGVPQDYSEAARWYRLSAEQGDRVSQTELGTLYGNGEGVPQDSAKALQWFRKSAETGYDMAQMKMGLSYYLGRGVPEDYVMAHMWYNLAAAQGNKQAWKFREELAKMMTPAQIAEAQKLAREWKPKK